MHSGELSGSPAQTVISGSHLTVEGKSYSGALSAYMIHKDGRAYHTFRTWTVLVDGEDICFRNCLFENTAGPGEEVGQAIALYLDGDGIRLENCVLRGHQDTLFLAPLPEKPVEKDGFLGPKEFLPRTGRSFYFEDCLIEGGIDFIFGGARAVFKNCEFRSVEKGIVFAPSTPADQPEGFVAMDCRFTAAQGVPPRSCYIARPWREHAAVRLTHCYLGEHIHPAGFDDWGKTEAHKTVRFEEYDSYGPGAVNAKRPYYVKHDLR